MSDTGLPVVYQSPYNRRRDWAAAAEAGGWWVARSVGDEVWVSPGTSESVTQAARSWAKRNGWRCETVTLRGHREVHVRFTKEAQ